MHTHDSAFLDALQDEKAVRDEYVAGRSSMGINTPISGLEMLYYNTFFPGQRLFVTTGEHPNRRQRRQAGNKRVMNNRKLTKGRLMSRVNDPSFAGLLQPTGVSTPVNLRRAVGKKKEFIIGCISFKQRKKELTKAIPE